MFDTFISYYYQADLKGLHKKLNIIMEQNERIDAALARLEAVNTKTAEQVVTIADAQTGIAGDLRRIKDELLNGADFNRVAGQLEEQATKAEAGAEALTAAAASLTALDKENEPAAPVEPGTPAEPETPVENPPADGGNIGTGNVEDF